MYSIPDEFAERLQSEFDGRLRIRWSYSESAFVVEQRIARKLADSFPVLGHEDDKIRLRDGYIYLMSIRPGDRMPCPNCGLTLKVPVFETGLISCSYCQPRRYDHQHIAGYFELNDRLLEYLRALDPLKGGSRRNRNRVDQTNARVEKGQHRYAGNVLEDAVFDQFTSIAGIPSVGYTGKVFPGTEL
jgi:hypothetical protein